MNFKLTIFPAVEVGADDTYTTFRFETKKELIAANYCAADLLLFLQDKAKVMEPFSNVFICEEFIEGEWCELDEK